MNTKNFLFLGMPYTGKSYAAAYTAANSPRSFVVIIHNVKRDRSYLEHIPQQQIHFVAVTSGGYLVPPHLFQQVRQTHRYLWLTVYDLTPQQVSAFLDSVTIAAKLAGNLLLLIDEARVFCASRYVSDTFIGFVRGARRFGVDFSIVTHRYVDIEVNIRVVFNVLVLFRVVEPQDLEALRATPLGPRVADVPTLATEYHLFVNVEQGSVNGPLRI